VSKYVKLAVIATLATLVAASACAAPLRIVTFGTSLTRQGLWQESVRSELEKCGAGPIEIINIARGGSDSRWGIAHVGDVVAARPDIVLMEFAYNDALVRYNISVSESRALTAQIVRKIKQGAPNTYVYLMTMNAPIGSRSSSRPQLRSYYENYRALARQEGVGLVDNFPSWSSATEDMIPDGVHPTALAHRAITVRTILRSLSELCAAR
jgi:acyl-CoA thioesterase I